MKICGKSNCNLKVSFAVSLNNVISKGPRTCLSLVFGFSIFTVAVTRADGSHCYTLENTQEIMRKYFTDCIITVHTHLNWNQAVLYFTLGLYMVLKVFMVITDPFYQGKEGSTLNDRS